MSLPTERQKSKLKEFGLDVLPTSSLCFAMISFILKGNIFSSGTNVKQRIAMAVTLKEKWTGKRVRSSTDGEEEGIVKYLEIRNIEQTKNIWVLDKKGEMSGKIPDMCPFVARVKFDSGKSRIRNLSSLERLL